MQAGLAHHAPRKAKCPPVACFRRGRLAGEFGGPDLGVAIVHHFHVPLIQPPMRIDRPFDSADLIEVDGVDLLARESAQSRSMSFGSVARSVAPRPQRFLVSDCVNLVEHPRKTIAIGHAAQQLALRAVRAEPTAGVVLVACAFSRRVLPVVSAAAKSCPSSFS